MRVDDAPGLKKGMSRIEQGRMFARTARRWT